MTKYLIFGKGFLGNKFQNYLTEIRDAGTLESLYRSSIFVRNKIMKI